MEDLKFLKSYIGGASVEKLMQKVKDGTFYELKIPYDKIPFDKIAYDFRPTAKDGAFDNKQLQQLAIKALNSYIQDPSREYSGHYYSQLFNEPRMLDASRYKHFVDIYNTLAPLNERENKTDKDKRLEEKIMLMKMEKAGILSAADQKKLEYYRTQDAQELAYLELKEKDETLSADEKLRLDKIREDNELIRPYLEDSDKDEDEDY